MIQRWLDKIAYLEDTEELKDKKQMVVAMVISGALCGLAGVFEVIGVHYRFYSIYLRICL